VITKLNVPVIKQNRELGFLTPVYILNIVIYLEFI